MTACPSRFYRSVVREVAKAVRGTALFKRQPAHIDLLQSHLPPAQRNKEISANFRALFDRKRQSVDLQEFTHDVENVVTFMRSQRRYKTLLDRYNPLIDLTSDERIEATARRVGLNMPTTPSKRDE
ncbi:hypothetical protein F5I97DRAFT_1806262 [Phlebopus sp. FC_14]|nr:hypothetical protein F5I97DRAFT_1806262 [Phlebopus sp. FC_14]